MAVDRGRRVVPHGWKSGIGIAAAHVTGTYFDYSLIGFLPAPVSNA